MKLYPFKLIAFFSIAFILNSCEKFNEPYESEISADGCLVGGGTDPDTAIKSVDIYLETSGSMAGYMPNTTNGQLSTRFQETIVGLVNRLRSNGISVNIFQIIDTGKSIAKINQATLTKNINNGEFQNGTSTDIPTILDSILIRKSKNPVILISDLIFSPADGSSATLKQISGEIERRFANTGLSSSIFQMDSEFYNGNNLDTQNSPYYLWIIGKNNQLLNLRTVARSLATDCNEAHFDFKIPTISYSLLADLSPEDTFPVSCLEDQNTYVLTDFKPSTSGSLLWIGLDLSNVPRYIRKDFRSHIRFNNEGYTAEIVKTTDKNPLVNSDKKNSGKDNELNYFIQVKLTNVAQAVTLIKINITDGAIPMWMSTSNEEVDVKNRSKTYGLIRLAEGLGKASQTSRTNIFNEDMKLLITTKSFE